MHTCDGCATHCRFVEGMIEYLDKAGIADESVDLIISNCVVRRLACGVFVCGLFLCGLGVGVGHLRECTLSSATAWCAGRLAWPGLLGGWGWGWVWGGINSNYLGGWYERGRW